MSLIKLIKKNDIAGVKQFIKKYNKKRGFIKRCKDKIVGNKNYLMIDKKDRCTELTCLFEDPYNGSTYLNTPLGWACVGGCVEIVKILIDAGCDVNRSNRKDAILWKIMMYGRSDHRLTIINLLIDAGCNVNQGSVSIETPFMAAVRCGHKKIVKILIDAKCDINGFYRGIPALIYACIRRDTDVVQMLIDAKYNINIANGIYGSPLMHTCTDKKILNITKMLIRAGCDVDMPWIPFLGVSAFIIACKNNNREVVKLLIKNYCIVKENQKYKKSCKKCKIYSRLRYWIKEYKLQKLININILKTGLIGVCIRAIKRNSYDYNFAILPKDLRKHLKYRIHEDSCDLYSPDGIVVTRLVKKMKKKY